MTSAKVMLAVVSAAVLSLAPLLGGCELAQRKPAPALEAPYAGPQVWAVAPLRNESGSRQVDRLRVADHLTQQIERVDGLSAVPVNRVLAAMESLELEELNRPEDAAALRQTLGIDALLVGTVTAFDPYDPPTLGMAVELYTGPEVPRARVEIRELTRAATDETVRPERVDPEQPVSVVSGHFDAAAPDVRGRLKTYGRGRGVEEGGEQHWRRYRINMDLYTEFVSYLVSEQLLEAERDRIGPSHSPARRPTSAW